MSKTTFSQNGLIRAYQTILSALLKERFVSSLHRGFSNKESGTHPNGLSGVGCPQAMLEEKNYMNLDLPSPILAPFIDSCTGWDKEAPLSQEHLFLSELTMSTKKRWQKESIKCLNAQLPATISNKNRRPVGEDLWKTVNLWIVPSKRFSPSPHGQQ